MLVVDLKFRIILTIIKCQIPHLLTGLKLRNSRTTEFTSGHLPRTPRQKPVTRTIYITMISGLHRQVLFPLCVLLPRIFGKYTLPVPIPYRGMYK